MGATLEALLALQDVELQIVDIRRQLAAKQRSVKRQTAKLRATQEELAAAQEELKRSQMDQDALDLDLKSRNAQVNRLRENLNSVKTNKEYAAVLSQLNTDKADLNKLEQRAFQTLETIESRKQQLAEQQQAVEQETARLKNLEGQYEQSRGSFSQRLEELQAERSTAAEKLDSQTLSLFERVSERYEGEAMAKLVRVHPRRDDFVCDGCQMSLAAERANALMTRDDVITCDNCGRILFIEPGT